MVPPAFLRELEKLQDRIPPFPTPEAFAVIESELGRTVGDVFSSISADSIAAASLGQVYRATLREDGSAVAVKVQRPGVGASIALDVFILRGLVGALKKAGRLNTDLPALLDEWAGSLFRELDYQEEGANGLRFKSIYGDMEVGVGGRGCGHGCLCVCGRAGAGECAHGCGRRLRVGRLCGHLGAVCR